MIHNCKNITVLVGEHRQSVDQQVSVWYNLVMETTLQYGDHGLFPVLLTYMAVFIVELSLGISLPYIC